MPMVKGYRDGEYFELDESELNQPGPPPPPGYRDLRAAAYRDELGKEQGDPVKTLGDVIDVLIAEVDALRAGRPETDGFKDTLRKVQAIKDRLPPPKA